MMNTASKQTLHTIEQIVKPIPIGTNLGLLQLIWTLLRGSFLPARGAVHTALLITGLSTSEIRSSWQALRYGVWHIQELIDRLNDLVIADGKFSLHQHGGYQPISVDTTAIWRPKLKNWSQKLYRQLTGKAYVGIGYGLIAHVGQLDGHRMPLLKKIVRGKRTDHSDKMLKRDTLKQAVKLAGPKDVIIHDGGAEISDMFDADAPLFVLRLATNCTARRNILPTYKGRGRYPTKGNLVRPLERKFKEKVLPATPNDKRIEFELEGVKIIARGWVDVVPSDTPVDEVNKLFTIWIIDDPRFEGVLVLGTNLPNDTHPSVIYQLYIDRWPVEQIPLVAKQLLGCQRQYVFSTTSCWRLGELAFFAANLLTWLALTMPLIPSGYWDRQPKKRPGDSEESWRSRFIQKSFLLKSEFEKRSRLPTICPRELMAIGA